MYHDKNTETLLLQSFSCSAQEVKTFIISFFFNQTISLYQNKHVIHALHTQPFLTAVERESQLYFSAEWT